MSTLTTIDTATSFPDEGGDLLSVSVLRLVRSGSEPQSWSLPMGRCTLGSSRQCQIHLPDEHVRPLHCLIVHDANKTLITRWATGALLNGKDFSTAPFQPGDQLTIGDIELQLVTDEAQGLAQRPPADKQEIAPTAPKEVAPTLPPSVEQERPVSPPLPTVTPTVTPTEKSADELASVASPPVQRDRKLRRLWLANFNARSRCRQLIGSMRELRTNSAGLDQQINALRLQLKHALDERQQLAGELKQRQTEMVERDQQATAEVDRLISELSAACERANASESAASEQALAGERLREEIASLASQCQRLELAHTQAEQDRILFSQELTDRDHSIEQLQRQLEHTEESSISTSKQSAELAETVERLHDESNKLRTERDGLAAEQATLGDQLRVLEQNLVDRQSTIDVLHQQLEQAHQSTGQIEEQSAELAETVERLQDELNKLRTERDGFAAEQATFGDQLRELEQNLVDRQSTIDVLHQQLEQSQQSTGQSEEQLAGYVTTIEDLHAELKQKEAQRAHLEELQSGFTKLRQELEESLAERDHAVEDLQRRLHEADQSADGAREREAAFTDTISALQAKLNEQQAEHERLIDTEANAVNRLNELENALAERDRQIKGLQQEHEATCQTLHSLEENSFEQVSACKRLEEELAELRTERDELAAMQSDRGGQLGALEAAVTERGRTIEALNEHLSVATQRRAEMESEVAQHAETYHELEVEAEELRARCQTLADEQNVSRLQQHELEQSVAGSAEHIATLTAELESVRQEFYALQKAAEEQSGSQEVLVAELAELRELQYDINQKYEAEFERRQQGDQEFAQRADRIELLEIDLRSAQGENKQFFEKLALSEQVRATAEEQLTQLREEAETLTVHQDSLAEAEFQARKQRDELATELETARQQLLQLQQQADTASDVSSAHSEQLTAMEDEKSALAESLATEQNLVRDLSSELERTREQQHNDQQLLQQSEALYQESQSELAAAKEGLLIAEQALQIVSTSPASYDVRFQQETEAAERLELAAEPFPTAGLSEELEQESPDLVAEESAAEEAIEHLRKLSVWVDKEEASALEDDNQAPDAVTNSEVGENEFKPISYIDQHNDMFNEDVPVESFADSPRASAAPIEEPTPELDGPATPDSLSPEPSQDESGDVALEDYMGSLMRRVRGDSKSSSNYVEPKRETRYKESTASHAGTSPQESPPLETEAETEVVDPIDLDSLRNSSRKPQLPTDMRAMRELANSSARGAIAKHSKRRHVETAFSTFLVCVIATGVAVYMMLTAESFQSPLFLGGLIPAFVGLRWGVKLLGVLLNAIREGSVQNSVPAEISIDDGPLPIDGRAELQRSDD